MKDKRKTGGEQTIEELQTRYQELHTKKIQAETNFQHAKDLLENLKREAREKYGTDDLAELKTKLDAMIADNEEKRRSYQMSLDRIEADLASVEAKFASVEVPSAVDEGNA
jgi:chromosome segregation ATPase